MSHKEAKERLDSLKRVIKRVSIDLVHYVSPRRCMNLKLADFDEQYYRGASQWWK